MSDEKSDRWLKAVLAFCVLFLSIGCGQEPKSSSEGLVDQRILAEFTIEKGGDFILLPVDFKGKEYSFVLDTGCSHTVFDSSLKHELGDVKRIERGLTAGGLMAYEMYDAPAAFLGPFNMQDCDEIFCIDFRMLSYIQGKRISGVIGMNFLRKYAVQIDFDKGVLSFLRPIRGQNPDWGEELEVNYDSLGVPHIMGNIHDGIKVNFVIDTGDSSSGALEGKIFDDIISRKKIKTSETLVATASGTIRLRETRITNLRVGSFEYQDLIFCEGIFSCLGLSFLSRHLVTLDFQNNRIYLKKGNDFKKIDETDMSGLHLIRISNKTIVHSVDEGSSAWKAGVRAKDVILKIGDKDVNEYEMWEIRDLKKSGDKRKIAMTIKRGNDIKEISFMLEKKI
jgi:predicted aspartyl protease